MGTSDRELAHFGVKGMHWGVIRRNRPPASTDAVKVRESMKTVKKGGTQALSTKELQELVNRINLEQQYARLQSTKKQSRFDTGHNLVKTTLSAGKTMNDVMSFLNSPFGKIVRGGFNKK